MLTHALAILGLVAAIIGWYLVQRLAFGPDGATACGKPLGQENDCDNRWDLVGGAESAPPSAARRESRNE